MEYVRGRVSVIMPVYNAEPYLRDIMDDLINQSYIDMELIVIDDGSTDRSVEIIQEYLQLNDKVIFLHIDNGGPSKARNIGLKVAKGEYVRFVDADDRLPKDSMEKMIQVYKDNVEVDLIIGNFITDINKGHFTGKELHETIVDDCTFAEIFVNYIKTFYFGVPWNKLYKRIIIEDNNIRFNESIIWCEDFLFNVNYYSKCKKMFFLNQTEGIYKYFIRETGITSNMKYYNIDEIRRIDTLRYNEMKKYCIKYGLLDRFELEWKYSELYEKLSNLTKYFGNDYVWEKYKKFKENMVEDDIYQYVSIKWDKTNAVVWKLLKEAKEKDSYLKVFLYFIFKGIQYRYIKNTSLIGEKVTQDEEMKLL